MKIRRVLAASVHFVSHLLHLPLWIARGNKVPFCSRVGARSFLVNSRVGNFVYLGEDVYLIHSRVGNYCSIAAGTKIGGMEHSWWWGSTSPRLSSQCIYGKETSIGDDVWIGFNVSIRQGVRVGRGAVIGSGAVVVKDVAPYSIVVGVPAREIRKRFRESIINALEASRFWEFPPLKAKTILENITYPERAE